MEQAQVFRNRQLDSELFVDCSYFTCEQAFIYVRADPGNIESSAGLRERFGEKSQQSRKHSLIDAFGIFV